jgi:hypothetical protein
MRIRVKSLSWALGLGNSKDEGELLSEIAHNCELGNDFPFRDALEGLASEDIPYRLLDEWARRDTDAAWEWSHPNVRSTGQLEDMAEA